MVSARELIQACALACALLAGIAQAAEPAPAKLAETEAVPEVTAAAGTWMGSADKGQWIRTRVTLALAEGRTLTVEREQHVTDVREDAQGRHITIEDTSTTGGNTDRHEQRFLIPAGLREPEPAPASEKAEDDTVTVAGAKITCEVRVRKLAPAGPMPHAVKTWSSAKVPFGGFIRIEHDGKPVFELLDYGPRK